MCGVEDADAQALLATLRGPPRPRYELTRFAMLRLLGLIYAVAFASLAGQLHGLIGSHGILPASELLDRLREDHGGWFWAFVDRPTIFFVSSSDAMMIACAWIGFAVSMAVALGLT